jgi:hypothetical protein
MISLALAKQLKDAGLLWEPQTLDLFGLPERNMDERVFVISDMLVTIEMLKGLQVVSFQGASEWALDYLVTTEAVWIPREDQLRTALEALLLATGRPELHLYCGLTGCRLDLQFQDDQLSFQAEDASHAYAAALLHLLATERTTGERG